MGTKRVLVTGASRGIGRGIALELGRRGWSVAVHYCSHQDEAETVSLALGSAASGIYQADLSDPQSAAQLWKDAWERDEIHALVNNAGLYVSQGIDDAGFEEAYSRVFAINFESPLRLTREAIKSFRGGGKVLNVASRVGFRGEPGAALYAASKSALINLTRSLAVELAPRGIGMFGIAPGWVDTAMARDGMDDRLQAILSTIPLGRMASVQDCASAAAYLLSDEAAYLSGQVIDINGASYFH
jgi:3-oxoacyl-[acyl-carrier protein] reductase